MSEQTNIAWCDSTINFWSGCTKVSDGCANCYAEALSNRFATKFDHRKGELASSLGSWGKGAPRVLHESAFKLALMNRKPWVCDECGCAHVEPFTREAGHEYVKCKTHDGIITHCHRRRIFSMSLGDWLDPEVPIEWLARMLDTIRQCDQVTWVLCTKRPGQFYPLLQAVWRLNAYSKLGQWVCDWVENGLAPANIILLTSVENKEAADRRIPELLKIPAVCHGLSLEPLLGPVDLTRVYWPDMHGGDKWENCLIDNISDDAKRRYPDMQWPQYVKWIIIGGESGPKARLCNVEWIRSLVRQGKTAGVLVFVKQLGSNPRCERSAMPRREFAAGYEDADPLLKPILQHPKGGDPSEWPQDLRVREWPQ